MTSALRPLRAGVLARSSQTDWPLMLSLALRAEALGFDSLWTNDHLVPIVGQGDDPILEGWMVLAAWGQATVRARVGLAMSCNTFRNPALVAKMVTTLDHITDGRAILGIGAGWYELEHRAYGFDFGRSQGERIGWLEQALPIIAGMLSDAPPGASSRYGVERPPNRPRSVQERIPIVVGGDGDRTLRLAARFGQACNLGPRHTLDEYAERLAFLDHQCEASGRDPREVERTMEISIVVIRDSRAEAMRRYHETGGDQWTGPEPGQGVGPPEALLDHLLQLVGLGFTHFTFGVTSPYDDETVERLMHQVVVPLRTRHQH